MTDNHSYNTPERGTGEWHVPLNDNFDQLDTDVEIRDTESNRDQYTPSEGAKFFATDTGRTYLADGESWQPVSVITAESFEGKAVNNVRYATAYDGETLLDRIEQALADLPDGRGRIVVPPKPSGQSWQWTEWQLDQTAYNGIHIDILDGVDIRYHNDAYAITVDSGGDISTQLDGSTLKLTGGHWHATGDPDGFVRVVDTIYSHFDPKLVRGFTNQAQDSTVFSIEIADKWTENNYFSGMIRTCDIGVEFSPGSSTSFVDNTFDSLSVGARATGAVLRGNLSGVEFSDFVFFPRADGATGIQLDSWNLNGCQFRSPRFDEVADGHEATTAIASTSDYTAPGPTLYNPIMPTIDTVYASETEAAPVYAVVTDGSGFHIENLHPNGGGLSLDQDGGFALTDAAGETVFEIASDRTVESGGAPLQFSAGPRLAPTDLTSTAPADGQIAFHDGTGSYSESLCFAADGQWYNVVDRTRL